MKLNKNGEIRSFAVIFFAIIAIVLFLKFQADGFSFSPSDAAEITLKGNSCISSGGTVSTGLCCGGVGDFPNTCAIGACGCSPENSHEVKICGCPEGKCFDGNRCI